jgi:hypothetical protein
MTKIALSGTKRLPNGIKSPFVVKLFNLEMKTLAKSWPKLSIEARRKALENRINKTLAVAGLPPIKVKIGKLSNSKTEGAQATFNPGDRVITINELSMLDDQLSPQLLSSVFHEMRHLDQTDMVVRRLRDRGFTRKQIEDTGIDKEIIGSAFRSNTPLDSNHNTLADAIIAYQYDPRNTFKYNGITYQYTVGVNIYNDAALAYYQAVRDNPGSYPAGELDRAYANYANAYKLYYNLPQEIDARDAEAYRQSLTQSKSVSLETTEKIASANSTIKDILASMKGDKTEPVKESEVAANMSSKPREKELSM